MYEYECKYIVLEPTKTNRRNNGINNSIFMSLSTSASGKTMQKKRHDKPRQDEEEESWKKVEPSIYPCIYRSIQSASPNGMKKKISHQIENAKVLQSIDRRMNEIYSHDIKQAPNKININSTNAAYWIIVQCFWLSLRLLPFFLLHSLSSL